jgi:hypothetical protein
LAGYKELCNLAQDEDRFLILPQSGLTGWYFLAHGASSFSTGTSQASQGFDEHRIVRRAKGSVNPERFFEKSLLNHAEFSVNSTLRADARYLACGCKWCGGIEQSGVYASRAAAWHSVHAQGMLTADLQQQAAVNNRGRLAAIRKIIRQAKAFTDDQSLVGRDNPRYLNNWLSML